EAPVDEAPVDEAPVDEAPVDEAPVDEEPVARHRVAAESAAGGSQHAEGRGQSVAELLARLQATPTGSGGRRRRDD
ncbi:MAG: hypothetical protein JOZ49_08160, partial [Mycolicibacterium sp.]|nr:hypothetical protein [Mycolicibacterium sp.]